MPCGCADRLNTSKRPENIQSSDDKSNNKTLNLHSMASMSIDSIIEMYRKGYRLKETSI